MFYIQVTLNSSFKGYDVDIHDYYFDSIIYAKWHSIDLVDLDSVDHVGNVNVYHQK